MGIDSFYSTGGAIRLAARAQAKYDLKGVVEYLEKSDNVNVRAYGYLGAAESQFPEAMRRAEGKGFQYPNGLVKEIWNRRPIARLEQVSR